MQELWTLGGVALGAALTLPIEISKRRAERRARLFERRVDLQLDAVEVVERAVHEFGVALNWTTPLEGQTHEEADRESAKHIGEAMRLMRKLRRLTVRVALVGSLRVADLLKRIGDRIYAFIEDSLSDGGTARATEMNSLMSDTEAMLAELRNEVRQDLGADKL